MEVTFNFSDTNSMTSSEEYYQSNYGEIGDGLWFDLKEKEQWNNWILNLGKNSTTS